MISIIDYKAGNAPSVLRAVTHLGYEANLVNNPDQLDGSSHIILPGVGRAKATMDSLSDSGFVDVLNDMVIDNKVTFLGICVGLQILFEYSEEGDTTCLGWLRGSVKRFDDSIVRVPQMGWNHVEFTKSVPIETKDDYYYFVNSYYAVPDDKEDIWATSNYNGNFTAAVQHDNIYATQFHVEKSASVGLALLKNFLDLSKGE